MWKTFSSYFLQKPSTIIVEHTENSHNSRLYTIQHKTVRNSHLLSHKLAFSQVPQQLFFKQVQIALTQNSQKQQLTAHTPIVKRIMVSVTNTHPSSSNAQLCQLVPQMHKLLKLIKPMDIANYNINRYNGSFFSY